MARLHVRVQPRARRNAFTGWFGDLPKLAVAAPPVDGAANDAVISALAKAFGLRQGQIRVIGGAGSRTKRFEIEGISDDDLARLLDEINPRSPR